MEPAFGWTLLSPEATGRAEVQWREDVAGVRDEIGFLLLHQAYADRFFPRTSVQQTRFRYALFVPWIYQKVAALDHQGRRPQRTLRQLLVLNHARAKAEKSTAKPVKPKRGKRSSPPKDTPIAMCEKVLRMRNDDDVFHLA
jgi:hypothetical protein